MRASFIEARIQGAVDSVVNTASRPTIVGMVHPASGISYEPMTFQTLSDDCILITDILEATVRALEREKNMTPDAAMGAKDRLLANLARPPRQTPTSFLSLKICALYAANWATVTV